MRIDQGGLLVLFDIKFQSILWLIRVYLRKLFETRSKSLGTRRFSKPEYCNKYWGLLCINTLVVVRFFVFKYFTCTVQ